MKKYNIEVTEYQLKLLSDMCERMSRVMTGQLDYGIRDILHQALKRHRFEDGYTEEYYDEKESVTRKLDELKKICWDQGPSTSYGVGYSVQSDTLFDMYQVMRHELWKESGEERPRITVDAFPAHQFAKETPLIKIEKLYD